jgi:hypothetical protein
VVLGKNEKRTSSRKPAKESLEIYRKNLSTTEEEFFQGDSKTSQTLNNPHTSNATAMDPNENAVVEKTKNNLPNSCQTENTIRSAAEDTTDLAADFLKRLGYTLGRVPTKVYLDGENEVVEVSLQNGNAIVQIDNKTKEVKEYEIQDTETNQGFFKSRRRLLLMLYLIFIFAIILKLIL